MSLPSAWPTSPSSPFQPPIHPIIHSTTPLSHQSELLLLLKKHRKADNSSINQQPTNDGHDHSRHGNDARVREDNREGCASSHYQLPLFRAQGRLRQKKKHTQPHNHQKPRAEAAQIQHRRARALDKVIRVRAVAADPVGHGCQHVGGHHE